MTICVAYLKCSCTDHFGLCRMNSQTFQTLLKFVKPHHREYKGGCNQTSVTKMLAMTLNYLGSQTTIRHLAIQFGVMTDAFIQGNRSNYEGF